MTEPLRDILRAGWKLFVGDVMTAADIESASDARDFAWIKADGTRVSGLDLRLDALIRITAARHLPSIAVLSEETGLLAPAEARDGALVIVDPVDGTDSLLRGATTWWISVGVLDRTEAIAGFIYQPTTNKSHDATVPDAKACQELVVGMSTDQLTADQAAPLRDHIADAGGSVVSTPHAVEKVASVLEGRCAAAIYLPSQRSPHWHTWDLAACVAIASANGLLLRTLDGQAVQLDAARRKRNEPWICAADETAWNTVRGGLR